MAKQHMGIDTHEQQAGMRFADMLNSTGCLAVGKWSVGSQEATFLCRCDEDDMFLEYIAPVLLKESARLEAKAHICQQYRLDEDGDVIRPTMISIRSDSIVTALDRLGTAFLNSINNAASEQRVGSSSLRTMQIPTGRAAPIRRPVGRRQPHDPNARGATLMSAGAGDME